MAEDNLRKAADSALLTLVARWSMVVIIPVSGFMGAAVWSKLDRASESSSRMEEQFKALIERQLPDMRLGFNSRFDAQADRITAHDYRINRLEDWRNARGNP